MWWALVVWAISVFLGRDSSVANASSAATLRYPEPVGPPCLESLPTWCMKNRARAATDPVGTCPSFAAELARARTPRSAPLTASGQCGELDFLTTSTGLVGVTEYFDRSGRLIAVDQRYDSLNPRCWGRYAATIDKARLPECTLRPVSP